MSRVRIYFKKGMSVAEKKKLIKDVSGIDLDKEISKSQEKKK